ncbi:glycosyltransferase family 4 protein [Sphingomonas sp. PWP1-2]|uniref:glycosyltransferase family 4 protein n=1 Tax=Sphingomonas sp. PWP1-2 TaxID=2804558 RepID=UPI003CF197F5
MWWTLRFLLPIISQAWLERARIRFARRFARRSALIGIATARMFVDVTAIARNDISTGIQRVVRSLTTYLMTDPQGWDVVPVRYARTGFRLTPWPAADRADRPAMVPAPGDVFLGLDLSFDAIRRNRRVLRRLKREGTAFWFVVYDLLPFHTPQYFSAKVVVRFRWWLVATAQLANGYICISPHVADEMRALLATRFKLDESVDIRVIPMGFDMPLARAGCAAIDSQRRLAPSQPFVLAVGTVEPRKGYHLLLEAFQILWDDGWETRLVIVGASGWRTDALQRSIRDHAEFGTRLFWFTGLDDHDLTDLYDRAILLVAASYAEGFGLPVLEAIARSCPVLARDIPAFRAHAQYGLRYFPADADACQLSKSLVGAVKDAGGADTPPPAHQLTSWKDSARAVQAILKNDQNRRSSARRE